MTCTDPECGLSALVSQIKWCHPEMSAISGLIQTHGQRTPFQPPPSARETRVTDDEAQGTMGRRKMRERRLGTRQTPCCIYLYTSINAHNSTGSGVLIVQLSFRRFDKNDLLHRKVRTFSIYAKKFNKVKAVNLQTAKNSKKSMIVINAK